jgi:hypothetical protein
MTRALAATAALLAATCAIGCGGGLTINRILAEPDRYRRQDVTLKGEVVNSASLLGRGAYKLDDGTGTIWVVTDHGVPRRGADIKASGRIRDVVDVGGVVRLPGEVGREIGSGLVLVEREHRAR